MTANRSSLAMSHHPQTPRQRTSPGAGAGAGLGLGLGLGPEHTLFTHRIPSMDTSPVNRSGRLVMAGVGGNVGGSSDNARNGDERVCLVISCRCGLGAVLYLSPLSRHSCNSNLTDILL